MSTTSRGKTFENFVTSNLKDCGWTILFKSIRIRFGAIDFAGMWDIVAVRRLTTPPIQVQWFFIQCKSRKLYGKEKQALIDWKNTYGFEGINCAIAIKTKRGRRVGIDWTYL